MKDRLIIDGDTIFLEGFENIGDDETIAINIYGRNKVLISHVIPRPNAILACNNIIKLKQKSYTDQLIAEKLMQAGVKSGSIFLHLKGRYIADLFD